MMKCSYCKTLDNIRVCKYHNKIHCYDCECIPCEIERKDDRIEALENRIANLVSSINLLKKKEKESL
jgi:hypothetical protein